MAVEHLSAAAVHEVMGRVVHARRQVSEQTPESRGDADDAGYWERLFEANAAAVLGTLGRVQLPLRHVVRYRFYARRGPDLLVRPFVARAETDVSTIRRLLDWHPPPDARPGSVAAPARDVEFLYRHFRFEASAAGHFEYWVAIQELWASNRWIHSTVVADAEQLAQLTAGAGWQVEQVVERCEPAVVADPAGGVQLAVLLYSPLDRHTVTLHRIRITAEQAVEFAEAILVAHGPRGYVS